MIPVGSIIESRNGLQRVTASYPERSCEVVGIQFAYRTTDGARYMKATNNTLYAWPRATGNCIWTPTEAKHGLVSFLEKYGFVETIDTPTVRRWALSAEEVRAFHSFAGDDALVSYLLSVHHGNGVFQIASREERLRTSQGKGAFTADQEQSWIKDVLAVLGPVAIDRLTHAPLAALRMAAAATKPEAGNRT